MVMRPGGNLDMYLRLRGAGLIALRYFRPLTGVGAGMDGEPRKVEKVNRQQRGGFGRNRPAAVEKDRQS